MRIYIAVKYVEDYRGTEFPPSPLKLIQAIIASSQDQYMDVLSTLETQSPTLYALEVTAHYDYARFVINNDERLQHVNTGTKKKDIVRLFGCADSAHVIYEYEVPVELLPRLSEAVQKIHTLGRAGDWVFASVCETLPNGRFDAYRVADDGKTSLRVPMQGSVASLFAHYAFPKVPVVYKIVAYAKNPPKHLSHALFELTEPVPAQQATEVVERIRRAAMTAKIKNADGHDLTAPRLAIYPLPTPDFKDGMIRRVVISSTDTTLVKAATAKLAGASLGEDHGYLMPAEHDAVFSNYTSASCKWKSVTPVLQSGYHNGDAKKRARVYAKMFAHAGLPMPVAVCEVKRRTDDFKVSAKHGHDKLPRVNLLVGFAEPVAGVVAIGSGRYSGLGIFANV
ncbi:MAG: type I-U CRISPR-associated protein Csb2 [Candidatus Sulfotelmatobacter sp.]